MKISEQQIVESCRAWYLANYRFFDLKEVARWISEDLRVVYLSQWVKGDDVLNNEDEVAAVDWAKEHGFRMGNVEPVQAEFTGDADALKQDKDGRFMENLKQHMARKIGLHLLEHGFLTFEEMGDVSKPGDFRRTLGFRLVGRAVKPPKDEKK